ncbi:TlpA family protein disulfide reductase [Flagellimonas lutaonensis]|uniref:Thioredoxin domain-containing protein n=1 Tax=Flagellimonas lutaonensis TaxID=516051 RepID=A0A0D5YU08_9FLAO|nr:TlpA disulfide reductase family protein [Allomuricauda lutaonensis]AKA35371.1 hypothetical protein VC82_1761 [Allomuricauda lutaonensis]
MKKILLSIALGILFISCNQNNKQTDTKIKVGDTIDLSDYNLMSIKGQEIEDDKMILIDFWATWCGPCIASFPHLEKIQDRYKNSLQIIAISDEKAETVEGFLRKRKFDLTFMNDLEKRLHKKFDIKSIPISCLLSEDGEFLWAGNSENLESVLEQYQQSGSITDFELTELNRSYYDIDAIEVSNKNKFIIEEAENPERYIVKNQKLDNAPVNIEYISATLPEIIVDFLNVDRKNIINNHPELDTLLLDIKAKDKKTTYGQAKKDILNTIKDRYDFEVQEEIKKAEVYVLEVADETLLKQHIETIEGGGQAQIKNEQIEITRLNLEQLASYFQNKSESYIQYKGTNDSKYSFSIQRFETIAELASSLKNVGLAIKKTEGEVKTVTLN